MADFPSMVDHPSMVNQAFSADFASAGRVEAIVAERQEAMSYQASFLQTSFSVQCVSIAAQSSSGPYLHSCSDIPRISSQYCNHEANSDCSVMFLLIQDLYSLDGVSELVYDPDVSFVTDLIGYPRITDFVQELPQTAYSKVSCVSLEASSFVIAIVEDTSCHPSSATVATIEQPFTASATITIASALVP